MTTKGLQVDYVVLQVASPRSLQRNLSRSKTQRLPGPTVFTLVKFPVTDNGEDELVDYLEARLADVLVDASFSSAKKELVLIFELSDDSWNLSHLGYLYPGTTPVMIKLDRNRSCPWV